MSDLVTVLVQRLLVKVVANAYTSADHEIHFHHLFFFVVDNVLAKIFRKLAWLQTIGNVVKELFGVSLGVKEVAEVVENIIKKKVDYDSILYRSRKSVDEFIVLLHLSQAIVGPIVFKVFVDLVVQTIGQWLVLSESGQQRYPVVQIKGLVFLTQISIKVGDNIDETSHNK